MNKQYESNMSTEGRADTEVSERSSSAREVFTTTYRDINNFLKGTLTLRVEVQDRKVVKLRAEDSNGQTYQVVFMPTATQPGQKSASLVTSPSSDKEGKKHGDDDDDDPDECVKCDKNGCQVVKCTL